MRRGLIKDYANALCGIVSGWQAEDERLPHLQQHGMGVLEIDVLAEAARIDGVDVRMPTSTMILRSWLKNAAERDAWEWEAAERAVVTVHFDVEQRSRDGVPLWRMEDYRCRSELRVAGHAATGRLHKVQAGVFRREGGGWTLYEDRGLVESAAADVPELLTRYRDALDREAP